MIPRNSRSRVRNTVNVNYDMTWLTTRTPKHNRNTNNKWPTVTWQEYTSRHYYSSANHPYSEFPKTSLAEILIDELLCQYVWRNRTCRESICSVLNVYAVAPPAANEWCRWSFLKWVPHGYRLSKRRHHLVPMRQLRAAQLWADDHVTYWTASAICPLLDDAQSQL